MVVYTWCAFQPEIACFATCLLVKIIFFSIFTSIFCDKQKKVKKYMKKVGLPVFKCYSKTLEDTLKQAGRLLRKTIFLNFAWNNLYFECNNEAPISWSKYTTYNLGALGLELWFRPKINCCAHLSLILNTFLKFVFFQLL